MVKKQLFCWIMLSSFVNAASDDISQSEINRLEELKDQIDEHMQKKTAALHQKPEMKALMEKRRQAEDWQRGYKGKQLYSFMSGQPVTIPRTSDIQNLEDAQRALSQEPQAHNEADLTVSSREDLYQFRKLDPFYWIRDSKGFPLLERDEKNPEFFSHAARMDDVQTNDEAGSSMFLEYQQRPTEREKFNATERFLKERIKQLTTERPLQNYE